MSHATSVTTVRELIGERLVARNEVSRSFFDREADVLAEACREMSERFLHGGRLLAFGRGPSATDAQHVAVEFVHPVIVGKRALPALDVSAVFEHALDVLVRPDDIVMGFGPPGGDPAVVAALEAAAGRGAQTFALPGRAGSYAVEPPTDDPFIHQELVEVLYHTLWETVHVFFEHAPIPSIGGHEGDVGASAFLYPFLGSGEQDTQALRSTVAASIRAKAADDERLRIAASEEESEAIAAAVALMAARVEAGGTLLIFGNGGSATDATDWAMDCTSPGAARRPIPALSLSTDAAIVTALANDIGSDAMFLRQLIAHGRSGDVAVAISTSGGSPSVVAALREARRRGIATVALLGHDGGEIVRQGLADAPVVVRCDYIPRIQEVQASIYHTMIEAIGAVRSSGAAAP